MPISIIGFLGMVLLSPMLLCEKYEQVPKDAYKWFRTPRSSYLIFYGRKNFCSVVLPIYLPLTIIKASQKEKEAERLRKTDDI